MSPKILSIRPVPSGAGRTIARFDVELGGNIRLYGLLLREFPDGTRRIVGPQSDGRHFVTFLPCIAAEITSAASRELEGQHAEYRRTA
ncbi:hypothetical protein G6N74_25030 [Mesorhizobium sp. CGMCC 1.15528]|uniref:Uncharacterized protein n=1 Tax=Mesorhizobium zhangyense TaxID=1776730 RepID=A0A7C9RAN0_9HYPH|nr:hypothetical protein [Mesorhizobium zhangyense]NGN44340.1 hypothetical protein [Mesorhizobium zhangyense]